MIIQKSSDSANHFGSTEKTRLTLEEALSEFPDDKDSGNNVVQLCIPTNQNQQRNKA
ncbi:hypothetical protein OAP14_04075 [Aliiglaciecola sp.]|nr:hypothetical protein [Aliiglaciecola sp.]